MFGDIGFWELTLIMVVALLVIGPDRLPGLARKVGLYVGKAKRFVQNVKADIDQELAAEELKRIMKEHKESASTHEIIEKTREALDEAKEAYQVRAVPDDQAVKPEAKSTRESSQHTAGNEEKQQ